MPHRPGRQPAAVRSVRRAASVTVAAVTVLVGAVAVAPPVVAAVPPAAEASSAQVTADALPTAQIDGVAWSQVVSGDTVYAGGRFATARPAGAAPNTATVPRANFVAYTLSTGVMTSFAPQFDNQVYAVAVSPDGNTLYVGGQFTSVTLGATTSARSRLAAFDLRAGTLLPTFAPSVNYIVKTVVATNSTVYIGGRSRPPKDHRNRLAACRRATARCCPGTRTRTPRSTPWSSPPTAARSSSAAVSRTSGVRPRTG